MDEWRHQGRRINVVASGDCSMPVDVIHVVMGTIYILIWAFIGQFAICRHTDAEGKQVSRTP